MTARQVTEGNEQEQREEESDGQEEMEEMVKTIKIRAIQEWSSEDNKNPWMDINIVTNNTSFAFKAIANTGSSKTMIASDIAERAGIRTFPNKD